MSDICLSDNVLVAKGREVDSQGMSRDYPMIWRGF